MLTGGAISWRNAKQTLVATSTMEAKFVSCFEASSQGIWLKSFISRLWIVDSKSKPLRVYCDNYAAMFFTKNNKGGSRSTHINIKYLALKERVAANEVTIQRISTELMIADPLTEGISPKLFRNHVEHMGLRSSLWRINISLVLKLYGIYFVFPLNVYIKFENDNY